MVLTGHQAKRARLCDDGGPLAAVSPIGGGGGDVSLSFSPAAYFPDDGGYQACLGAIGCRQGAVAQGADQHHSQRGRRGWVGHPGVLFVHLYCVGRVAARRSISPEQLRPSLSDRYSEK